MSPSYSSHDAAREPAVRVVRRQLITAHGAKEMPTPRVVLHLPDLDALQTVALGPVRPSTSRRRIDAAHDVEPTAKRSARKQDTKKSADDAEETPSSPILNLLRVPLNKWLAPGGRGKLTAGSLVVLMQQPKMMLGAVVAVAMQLAAVLAMLGGGGTTTDKSSAPTADNSVAHTHSHSAKQTETLTAPSPNGVDQHASHTHTQRPIQTPLNVAGTNGQPFIAPSAGPSLLPAPQALTGVDAKDVPPWQAPITTLPTPASSNAPSPGTGNLVIGRPDGSSPTLNNVPVSNAPSTSTSGPPTSGPTNVVQTSGPTRAKLKGTIQRKSGAN